MCHEAGLQLAKLRIRIDEAVHVEGLPLEASLDRLALLAPGAAEAHACSSGYKHGVIGVGTSA